MIFYSKRYYLQSYLDRDHQRYRDPFLDESKSPVGYSWDIGHVSYTDKSTLHFGVGTLVPLYLFHGLKSMLRWDFKLKKCKLLMKHAGYCSIFVIREWIVQFFWIIYDIKETNSLCSNFVPASSKYFCILYLSQL